MRIGLDVGRSEGGGMTAISCPYYGRLLLAAGCFGSGIFGDICQVFMDSPESGLPPNNSVLYLRSLSILGL
jgi:hypothetical protein